jgi:hypothetical protein
MLVSESEITTDVRFKQPKKELVPRPVTELGITTDVRLVQPEKAKSGMDWTVSRMTTVPLPSGALARANVLLQSPEA